MIQATQSPELSQGRVIPWFGRHWLLDQADTLKDETSQSDLFYKWAHFYS